MSSLAVLDKTVCLMLRVSLWTGRRRLRAEDLGEAAQKLPPGDLASLGSLKLCDPKKLAALGAIKRAAERECEKVCVGFLGGYATEEQNLKALIAKLDDHQRRFDAEAATFAAGLQAEIDKWTALHPTWKSHIEKALPDAAHVRARFQFNYQAFRVGLAAKDDPQDKANDGLADATSGLSNQLFREIEVEAQKAWDTSYEGKAEVGQKALRPLKAILAKLEALSYLDPRCGPIIDQFNKVLGSLPKHGPIKDLDLSAVLGLFRVVQTRDTLRSHGAALLDGRNTSTAADARQDEEDAGSRDDSDSNEGSMSGTRDAQQDFVQHAPVPRAPAPEKRTSLWF